MTCIHESTHLWNYTTLIFTHYQRPHFELVKNSWKSWSLHQEFILQKPGVYTPKIWSLLLRKSGIYTPKIEGYTPKIRSSILRKSRVYAPKSEVIKVESPNYAFHFSRLFPDPPTHHKIPDFFPTSRPGGDPADSILFAVVNLTYPPYFTQGGD